MPEDNIPTPEQFLSSQKRVKVADNGIPTPQEFMSTGKIFDPTETGSRPNLEATIEELSRTSRGGLMDSEKQALRDLISNPNTTPEQAKRGIATIQGYDPKQSEDNTFYYLKQEENGVMMPQALAKGERPPSGYNIPSVWGKQADANDDSWYTDAIKSLYNAVPGVIGSVADLGQMAYKGVTGETSETLQSTKNLTDALKMAKDEDLNKQVYSAEGVKKWSDLVASERFDFGPEAIWGTLNSALETVPQFFLGAGAAAKVAQGVSGAAKIGKGAAATSAFTGSFLTMLGDNMDAAEEAGLQGRDVAKFAMTTTAAQASIDAAIGLPSKIFMNSLRQSEKELMKGIAKTVERDANGLITEEGFRQLAREVPVAYGQMIKTGAKEILKDAGKEAAQEVSQDMIEKSSKHLWDRMSDEDKGKFGVDALSPESFASYIQNGIAGFISGAPLAVASTNYKKKYQEQSKEVFDRVKAGPEAVNELKANLAVSRDKGHITPEEYDQAVFKVDAYNNYNEQTKDLDLTDEENKNAFELSFNIDALKAEIPTSKEDVEALDPIAQAKINTKKELMKGLQKELNDLILNKEVEKEPKVAEETKTKAKPKEAEGLDELLKKYGKTEKGATEVDVEEVLKATKPAREKIEEIAVPDWNDNNKTSSLKRKQVVQEALKTTPNNELDVTLEEGENGKLAAILEGGRRLDFAQSAPKNNEVAVDYLKRENLPEGVKTADADGRPRMRYPEPVKVKRVEVDARDLETDEVELDAEGKPKRKAVLSVYNPKTGKHIGFIRELDKRGFVYKSSKYSPTEKSDLNKITNSNHLTDEILPYTYRAKEQTPSRQTEAAPTPSPEKLGKGVPTMEQQPGESKPDGAGSVQPELTKREKELKAAAKPEISLDYIVDKDALVKEVRVDIVDSKGETDVAELKVVKVQADIRRRLEYLKKVLDCIHA